MRAAVSAGKRMHRVHVVVEPLSDYVRFECGWAYEHTVEAGEDVRLIGVAGDDWPAGLPHYDYWLFDSSQLVAMYYDQAGRFVSGELITEPEQSGRPARRRRRPHVRGRAAAGHRVTARGGRGQPAARRPGAGPGPAVPCWPPHT
nr:DUF6879 family protein [Micromonospora inyonensis]